MQFIVAIIEYVGTPDPNVRRKKELVNGVRCQGVHGLMTTDFAVDPA